MSDLEQRRRRASYRAHYRGTKEMDWLVGKYADARLAAMTAAELTRFETLLDVSDVDLNSWILDPGQVADRDLGPLIEDIHRFHGLADQGPQ